MVSISSKNNQHLQTAAVNCLNLDLCVPFQEHSITTRKLSDEHIPTWPTAKVLLNMPKFVHFVSSVTTDLKAFCTCHKIYIAAHYRKLGKI